MYKNKVIEEILTASRLVIIQAKGEYSVTRSKDFFTDKAYSEVRTSYLEFTRGALMGITVAIETLKPEVEDYALFQKNMQYLDKLRWNQAN